MDEIKYTCHLCEYEARFPSIFEAHMARHAPKAFECTLCYRDFRAKARLDNHFKEQHGSLNQDDPRSLKLVEDLVWLRAQMRSFRYDANKEKPFQCPVCDQWLKTKVGLGFHVRTHRDIREYPCTWAGCDKSFTQSGSLETHRKRHANIKAFKCTSPDCEKPLSKNVIFKIMNVFMTHRHIRTSVTNVP